MKTKENQLSEILKEIISVLRPEMQKAAWEGLWHYTVQMTFWETTSSEEDYYEQLESLLEKGEYRMPTLLQNSWKLWMGDFVECWRVGENNHSIQFYQEIALKNQELLDEKVRNGADLSQMAE